MRIRNRRISLLRKKDIKRFARFPAGDHPDYYWFKLYSRRVSLSSWWEWHFFHMFRTHSNSCFRIMDLGSRFTAHFKDLNTKKELSFFGWSGQVGLVGFSKLLVF